MMTRCEECGRPIEIEDLVEEENPDDPLQPLHYHIWDAPNATEQEKQQEP